jgi:type I restriction enzyme, S subunit
VSNSWKTIALRDLCSIARGGSPRPIKNFITNDPDGINWIKIGDTQKGGRYIDSTAEKIKPEGISRSRFVEAGSFLLSNSMSFGRPYILRTSGCIHDGWLVLEPDYERVDQDFLYHVLGSRTVFDQFDRLAAGSTVRNLNIGLVEGVEIPLPPLEEQQRIVAVLDEAFEGLARARAHAEANLQNARELFETCLSVFIERHEENWSSTSLGDAYDVRDGTHDSPKYHPTGRALITSKNLGRDGLHFDKVKFISEEDFEAIRKRSGVHKGDVLFAMIGTIGNPIVIDVEPDFAIKNVALFKMKDQRNGRLLRFLLRSKRIVEKMQAEAKGTTQQFVGLGYLRAFPVSLPKPTAEADLVDELDRIETECRSAEELYTKKLQDLDDLRQSLLQKAFAGELT